MAPPGDWQTTSVPKERCEKKRKDLLGAGWTVKPGCPEDPNDSRKCILTYRREYAEPPEF